MRRRTQLYLDEDQYRWLKRQAGSRGTIAGIVRELIDTARGQRPRPDEDPAIRFLLHEPPGSGKRRTTVADLDSDVYGK